MVFLAARGTQSGGVFWKIQLATLTLAAALPFTDKNVVLTFRWYLERIAWASAAQRGHQQHLQQEWSRWMGGWR